MKREMIRLTQVEGEVLDNIWPQGCCVLIDGRFVVSLTIARTLGHDEYALEKVDMDGQPIQPLGCTFENAPVVNPSKHVAHLLKTIYSDETFIRNLELEQNQDNQCEVTGE